MSDHVAGIRGAATGRTINVLLWCVQALLAFVFVNAAWAKLAGNPEMVALFTAVGSGQWFRYVTGILELTGAVLIVLPKTRRMGAVVLATVMLGAITLHLFILHVSLTTPGILFLMSGCVVWGAAPAVSGSRPRRALRARSLPDR
jgi:putative oxidoreductase